MTNDVPGYRLIARSGAINDVALGDDVDLGEGGGCEGDGCEDVGGSGEDDGCESGDVGRGLWRAARRRDDAAVAVKMFPAEQRARAEREAYISRSVTHPHLLAATEVVDTATQTALVFPWAAGGSLTTLIGHRQRITWPEALTVLIPLADALAAVHERGFVHGDLSANNVLFDGDGRPVLADFGAARAAVESGGDVWFTPTDVAPEVVRGGAPSEAADLFSLGSVALWCVMGRGAWPADDARDVLVQSAAGQWPELDRQLAPEALREVVNRLLSAEPDERGSAAQVALELRGVGEPSPVELVTRSRDGRIHGPAPATQVRADAVRPPAGVGVVGRKERSWARRAVAAVPWRPVAALVAITGLISLAIVGGLWWAERGQAGPRLAQEITETGIGAVVPTDSLLTDSLPTNLVPADSLPAGSHLPDPAPGPSTPAASVSAPRVDWHGVISQLDRARSASLAARDATLLRAVYLPGVAELTADAERISTMRDAGRRVISATHRIESVTVVGRIDGGDTTVEVMESMPSYAVYDAAGEVVGRTRPVPQSRVRIQLAPVVDGFRIRNIVRR